VQQLGHVLAHEGHPDDDRIGLVDDHPNRAVVVVGLDRRPADRERQVDHPDVEAVPARLLGGTPDGRDLGVGEGHLRDGGVVRRRRVLTPG
jgi:hypothetical protein